MATFTMTPSAGNEGKPGLLWSAFPHMHQLGTSIHVDLIRANGDKSCVIDVPKWDFHWQGAYQFTQPIKVAAGDKLMTTCVWDNSVAHQPLVDGVPQQPRDVKFGEGSTDELEFLEIGDARMFGIHDLAHEVGCVILTRSARHVATLLG